MEVSSETGKDFTRFKYPLVVKLDLDTTHGNSAKLCLKIKSVSDAKKEDMKEAIDQSGHLDMTALPSMVADIAEGVRTVDTFVPDVTSFAETWGPILKQLEAFQSIGNYLSEVSPLRLVYTG